MIALKKQWVQHENNKWLQVELSINSFPSSKFTSCISEVTSSRGREFKLWILESPCNISALNIQDAISYVDHNTRVKISEHIGRWITDEEWAQ